MNEGNLTLTQEEGNALIELIDVALKTNGLKSAQNSLVLVNKIQLAFQEQQELPVSDELKKEKAKK